MCRILIFRLHLQFPAPQKAEQAAGQHQAALRSNPDEIIIK
jgi:hypothetical protein